VTVIQLISLGYDVHKVGEKGPSICKYPSSVLYDELSIFPAHFLLYLSQKLRRGFGETNFNPAILKSQTLRVLLVR
jgi:hypothetical protein